eukprot:CAMPEP_0177600676 /NCGR_PEP_ID=MMETSP0419_2-20121207/13798_1 /TAXON_ID=582737 /ORGANISM="Tetraselmis sp., Strain GSL018" /LENGTH=340 /DNA_ID=CAMNT_0019093781 /DNA_START=1214 /DNA_END=2237 /DNA_ORIENTATION=-
MAWVILRRRRALSQTWLTGLGFPDSDVLAGSFVVELRSRSARRQVPGSWFWPGQGASRAEGGAAQTCGSASRRPTPGAFSLGAASPAAIAGTPPGSSWTPSGAAGSPACWEGAGLRGPPSSSDAPAARPPPASPSESSTVNTVAGVSGFPRPALGSPLGGEPPPAWSSHGGLSPASSAALGGAQAAGPARTRTAAACGCVPGRRAKPSAGLRRSRAGGDPGALRRAREDTQRREDALLLVAAVALELAEEVPVALPQPLPRCAQPRELPLRLPQALLQGSRRGFALGRAPLERSPRLGELAGALRELRRLAPEAGLAGDKPPSAKLRQLYVVFFQETTNI